MRSAAGRQFLAVVAVEHERELFLSWNDGDAFRRFQEFLWNALVGSVHDLLEVLGRVLNTPNVITAVRHQSGQDQAQARNRNDQEAFKHDGFFFKSSTVVVRPLTIRA